MTRYITDADRASEPFHFDEVQTVIQLDYSVNLFDHVRVFVVDDAK